MVADLGLGAAVGGAGVRALPWRSRIIDGGTISLGHGGPVVSDLWLVPVVHCGRAGRLVAVARGGAEVPRIDGWPIRLGAAS
jgi:hypothetical protein